MSSLIHKLTNTKTATWYDEHGRRSGRRREYTQYFNATVNATGNESPSAPIDRNAIVNAMDRQSASTIYKLFGPRANVSLLNQHDEPVRDTQKYREVVDGLVIESKVSSHHCPKHLVG